MRRSAIAPGASATGGRTPAPTSGADPPPLAGARSSGARRATPERRGEPLAIADRLHEVRLRALRVAPAGGGEVAPQHPDRGGLLAGAVDRAQREVGRAVAHVPGRPAERLALVQ